MALIVEDGTGLSNSESFASLDQFLAYHGNRGNDLSATNLRIEQALRQATDYMEARWGLKWTGARLSDTQALSWPRTGAYYPDGRQATGVPQEIYRACLEYALRAITEPLAPDPTYGDVQAPVIEREERVGPIMEKTVYGSGGAQITFRKYPVVDQMIKPLLTGGGGGYLTRV